MSMHIAVDMGGTQIRAACFASDSLEPRSLKKISTSDPHASPLERLVTLIESTIPADESVDSIAVAAPGPLDPYRGIILEAPNIPGWINVPLKEHLERHFNVPVAIGNDANLAALGEWQFGAGRGHHYLVYLTVSTGIGGGVIIDDRLLLGAHGLAAELGHVTIMPDGPLCGCGQRGHLEAVASGLAIARWTQEQIAQGAATSLPAKKAITGKMVAEAAAAGDALARQALERAGRFIGIGVANYLQIFNPTVVIIGGGVSLSGSLLMDPLRASMEAHVMAAHYLDQLVLTTAALGDEAGLMGALVLARRLVSESPEAVPSQEGESAAT